MGVSNHHFAIRGFSLFLLRFAARMATSRLMINQDLLERAEEDKFALYVTSSSF